MDLGIRVSGLRSFAKNRRHVGGFSAGCESFRRDPKNFRGVETKYSGIRTFFGLYIYFVLHVDHILARINIVVRKSAVDQHAMVIKITRVLVKFFGSATAR